MLSALIAMIMSLFVFFGAVTGDAALPALQNAQDEIIAALSEVTTQDEDTNGDNGENGDGDENGDDENGNEDENGDENGEDGDENGEENGNDNGENGDGEEPENNKVRAYNTAAGFVLPTMVAQAALDHSSVLISCEDPEADCEDTSPGNSGHAKNGNNGNGENGEDS